MDSAVWVQVVIVIGALATGLLGGIFSRRTRHVSAEVTLSTEARNWADSFEQRARAAELRAERAEASAREAMAAMNRANDRMDQMDRHIDRLERIVRAAGMEPPPAPFRDE